MHMQLKQGDPREAARLASTLLTSVQPLEVLHFGFQLLQSVVSTPLWTSKPGMCIYTMHGPYQVEAFQLP